MPKFAGLAPLAAAVSVALLLVTAPVSAQTAPAAPEPPTILQPGDMVRIGVWQRPDYNGEFLVTADSTLSHPLFQGVKVGGVPLAVAKGRLQQFLYKYEKDTSLVMLEPLLQVSVVGEVRMPNVYTVPRATTVAQAVARAGGPTENARIKKVQLLRGGREISIDLNDPQSTNVLLVVRSGDRIIVGRKKNFMRDILTPFASLTAAVVSIVVAVRR